MLPVVTFAAGLIAGAVGLQMLKKSKARGGIAKAQQGLSQGLDKAQGGLRAAAVSGLSAVERSAADLRARLEPTEVEETPAAEQPEAQPEPESESEEKREV